MAKLLQYEKDGDARVLENTPFTTHSAYTGYCTEDKEEYERLSKEHNHVVFTDRENIPDMKTIVGSQKLFHVKGSSKNTGKEMELVTSLLPCSCDNCLSANHENTDACVYKHLREIKTHTVERILEDESGDELDEDEEDEDYFGIKDLTIDELKTSLRERKLPTTGNKIELYERIIDDLETQEDNPEYEEHEEDRVIDESESDSSESENESESD